MALIAVWCVAWTKLFGQGSWLQLEERMALIKVSGNVRDGGMITTLTERVYKTAVRDLDAGRGMVMESAGLIGDGDMGEEAMRTTRGHRPRPSRIGEFKEAGSEQR